MKTYTLIYFSSKVILLMIKSHDKYQNIILIWLARAKKAYSRIRSDSVHNRSCWREWRPLVISFHYIGAGYLTYIISTALFSPFILLSLSSHMAIVCVQAISHIQYRQLGSLHYIGAGYLTYIISTALLSP